MPSELLSGLDIPTFANGPRGHLLDGTTGQNSIFCGMRYAVTNDA